MVCGFENPRNIRCLALDWSGRDRVGIVPASSRVDGSPADGARPEASAAPPCSSEADFELEFFLKKTVPPWHIPALGQKKGASRDPRAPYLSSFQRSEELGQSFPRLQRQEFDRHTFHEVAHDPAAHIAKPDG